jgi:hypothetical protein
VFGLPTIMLCGANSLLSVNPTLAFSIQPEVTVRNTQMRNPWIKKNPLISIWMSGANALLGSARSRATAEAKRQAATMMAQGAKQMARFWSGALMTPPSRKKKRSR